MKCTTAFQNPRKPFRVLAMLASLFIAFGLGACQKDTPPTEPDVTVVLQAGGRRLLNRMMYNDSLTKLNHYEAGADLALSPSITRSFLEYQKLLRRAFMEKAEQDGHPVIHTRSTVLEVHAEVWSQVKPTVADMLQAIKK